MEPVEAQKLAAATICAGSVVVFGACYAICLALSKLTNNKKLRIAANASYLLLAASACLLAYFLELTQWWLGLIGILLVGYYFAPRFIWQLSVATHKSQNLNNEENGK